ncbi:hypothetical protein A3860_36905 [Niastella vici]|uniref:PKD domain-containing protein n=1 Tax=Niastella vici TaxID=1703345 RepID=A0A1V9FMK0_9BACT|nr:PKD domain-containing protein [Niastella vici]OQP59573.1 hypothetical protein A3860_36905 [Niastella vici]
MKKIIALYFTGVAFHILIGCPGVQAQLTANFSAASRAGCGPLLVNFTDQSIGNPDTWEWDLGNGTISYFKDPAVTYFNPGTYTIRLTVKKGTATASITKTQYITVYAAPVINFTHSTSAGCFPLKVKFTNQSTAGSGSINSWLWDFGDGVTSTLEHPEHIYNNAGDFNSSLRAFNSFGCTASVTRLKAISIQTGVQAAFTVGLASSCQTPATIAFTNTSTGTGTLSYSWDLGDGSFSVDANPVHTYINAGQYAVRLTTTNNTGCTHTYTKNVAVGANTGGFTAPAISCINESFALLSTAATNPVSISWDMGDGATATGDRPTHAYTATGNYTVTQVARFNNCIDTQYTTIQIIPRPAVDFTAAVTASCKAPFTTTFTAGAPGAVSYAWNFGDGATSTQPQPAHTYTAPGSFTVSLTITNSAGCAEKIEKAGYIVIQKPVVTWLDKPQEGCVPYTFSPTLTINSVTPVTGLLWNFGDGATATGANPVHTYTQKGNYAVSVTYTTQDGCQETLPKDSLIKVGNKVTVAFTASPLQVCASSPVLFTDLSAGNPPADNPIEEWLWQFGDGDTSHHKDPVHYFIDTGRLSVTLTVKSNGCASGVTYTNYVHIAPPIARFLETMNCSQPYSRSFLNTSLVDRSLAPVTFQWDFGDGSTANSENASHVYAATGIYTVRLTVINGGCRHAATSKVFIVDNTFSFTASADTICPNGSIQFNKSISNTDNLIDSYIASSNSGQTWRNTNTVTEKFATPGSYTVTAFLIDTNRCSKLIELPVKVIDTKAGFTAPAAACINTPVPFTDGSTTDAPLPFASQVINYGDGSADETNPPSFGHTYTKAGLYTIRLTVTDSKGCSNTTAKTTIQIADPQASFISPDSLSCTGKNIVFNALGPSTYTYKWDFGDGTTATGSTPTHNYTNENAYTIQLDYTDQYGCSNSITRQNYVQVNNPVAAFSINGDQSNCPPLVVQFTNQSQHIDKLAWDFGDGNTSTEKDPVHFYTYPGEYWPVLTITGKGGCVSIMQNKKITINGPRGTLTYDNLPGCTPLTVHFKGNSTDPVTFIWDFNDGAIATTSGADTVYTYVRPGSYLPRMILKDVQGCQVPIKGKDTLTVYGIQANYTTDKQTLCDQGIIRFTGGSISNDLITNYLWTFGDGTVATTKDVAHNYTTPGDYPVTLQVTTQHNCTSDTAGVAPIQVITSPQAGITGPTAACMPGRLQFTGNLLNANPYPLTWTWNLGNGQTAATQAPPVAAYTTPGSYQVALTVTNSYNCTGRALYPIIIHPLPPVDAGNDILVCRDRPKLLQATGAVNYTWWSTGSLSCTQCSSTMVNPVSTVTYYVEGENGFGCKATDSVLVTVQQPFTVMVNRGDTLCTGDTYRLRATGADAYTWTPASSLDNAQAAAPLAKPVTTTVYQVIGSDKNNCFADTAHVPVVVYPYPTITLNDQQTVTVGNSVTLQPVLSADVTSINWLPGTWLNCVHCPAPVSTPKQDIQYRLRVANAGGCVTEDAITLFVVCGGDNVYLPNTFSPNGDGVNEVFYPRGKGISFIKRFFIYNRWGEEVFKQLSFYTNDASRGWNGTINGAPANADVFVYVMEVICENGQTLTFKGDVTLIR